VFLALVRMWAEYHHRRGAFFADTADTVGEVAADVVLSVPRRAPRDLPDFSGGRFGGGGAARSWEPAVAETSEAPAVAAASGVHLPDVDLDEGLVVVLPIVLIVSAVSAALLCVWGAPVLLAEVLLDVMLVSGLYRRLRTLEPRSWLATAVRRTWAPVVMVALVTTLAAAGIEWAVPNADSIGDVFRPVR
jgi:hypothetical protein